MTNNRTHTKVAFVIPPRMHDLEPYALREVVKHNVDRPPLGLLYVAATLRERVGIEPVFIDCPVNRWGLPELENELAREQPDIVGFSVLTHSLLDSLEAGRVVRRVLPPAVICFGGWHPTLYPRETLALESVDIVAIGEGEGSFPELVSLYAKTRTPSEDELARIAGIGFRTAAGNMHFTSRRPPIKNLDDLPLPAYDLIDHAKYSNVMANTAHAVNIMTSRGCPHGCVFCDMRRTPFRARTPANVADEIQYWTNRGVSEFYLQDDNFTISRTRTMEFCRTIVARRMRINYKISSRVDCLDDEVYAQLKKSGCYRIHFGVESGCEATLKYLQKGITVEQIRRAFALGRTHKIDRFAYIMIGLPHERAEDIAQTTNLIKEISPDYLHCSICTPMPQTFLYRRMIDEGLIEDDYWLEFARDPTPAFQPRYASQVFSAGELRSMQESSHRKFYLRPRIVFREALRTRSLKQIARKARLALKLLAPGR
ncbi:MAG: radical SAM protein [Thermodesulfobacteriota bacterium]